MPDGNEYIDFMMSFGALIQGHAHPNVGGRRSVGDGQGSHFAAMTSAEVEAAKRFCRMVPSAEVGAIHEQRAVKQPCSLCAWRALIRAGRKFLKFEGHYHPWYDPYLPERAQSSARAVRSGQRAQRPSGL